MCRNSLTNESLNGEFLWMEKEVLAWQNWQLI